MDLTFRQGQTLKNAVTAIEEELPQALPSRLRISPDVLDAFDSEGRHVFHIKLSGTSAGSGWRWNAQHKIGETIHHTI